MRAIHPNDMDKITALRHELHRRPDLPLRESGTIRIVRDFLRENTSFEICDRDGWFYAVKPAPDPAAAPVAFRAELDALPMDESVSLPYGSVREGISHKCGHDGHMAALCGLALALDRRKTDRTVYLIFQPAEEIGRGGERCAELIPEKGIAEVYAFHNLSGYPENSLVYRRQLTQPASEGVKILLRGKPSHASAPEEGRSPAAALAELALYARGLPEEEPHEGLALCTVVGLQCGREDFGIAPGEGSVCVTLRAEQEPFLMEMEKKLLRKAEELAARDGLQTGNEIRDPFPETRNHNAALDRVLRKAAGLGMRAIEMEDMWRASEDFGYYLKKCPGALVYIGNGENYPAVHTDAYDFNDRILETAVRLFLALAEAD